MNGSPLPTWPPLAAIASSIRCAVSRLIAGCAPRNCRRGSLTSSSSTVWASASDSNHFDHSRNSQIFSGTAPSSESSSACSLSIPRWMRVEPLAELDRAERLRPLRGVGQSLGRADEQPSGDRRQLGGGRGGLLAGAGQRRPGRVALVADDGHSRFPKKTRVGGRNVASANTAPLAVGGFGWWPKR